MKNKILLFTSLLAGGILLMVACHKTEDNDSVVKQTSVPFIVSSIDDIYFYGEGSSTLFGDLPSVVGVAIDSVYGFAGGHGGKTGKDTLEILKTGLSFGDTTTVGGSTFSTYVYNLAGYRTPFTSTVVIVSGNANPGPTELEGDYYRAATMYTFHLRKVGPGIYFLDNPGGSAAVQANPYLLYNYRSSTNTDSLSFANQTNHCGTGLQLVAGAAPDGLTSADYSKDYPPEISSLSPITFKWKIFIFPTTDSDATPSGSCNWGPAVRTFVKQ